MPLNTTGMQITPCLDECIQPGMCYMHRLIRSHIDDPKTPVAIIVMKDEATGLPCHFLESEISTDGKTLGEPININDYPMNPTDLGRLNIDSNLIPNEVTYNADGFVLCLDETPQDLILLATDKINEYIAFIESCKPSPEGASWKLSKLLIKQFTSKRPVKCDITDVQVPSVLDESPVNIMALGNESWLVIGGKKPYGNPLFDNGDCIGCAKDGMELKPGDVIVNGKGAIQFDFCIACFKPSTVQLKK